MINLLVRRISSKCIQKPVPFHLVPYDEQYETRDFKRNVTSYPNIFRAELEELYILNNTLLQQVVCKRLLHMVFPFLPDNL